MILLEKVALVFTHHHPTTEQRTILHSAALIYVLGDGNGFPTSDPDENLIELNFYLPGAL